MDICIYVYLYEYVCIFQVKDAGRYKEVERTQGVSTTDLVNRMLERTRSTRSDADDEGFSLDDDGHHEETNCSLHPASSHSHSPWTGVSQFLQTTRKIHLFSDAKEIPVSIFAFSFSLFINRTWNFKQLCTINSSQWPSPGWSKSYLYCRCLWCVSSWSFGILEGCKI